MAHSEESLDACAHVCADLSFRLVYLPCPPQPPLPPLERNFRNFYAKLEQSVLQLL
jgi:hypothetical protein